MEMVQQQRGRRSSSSSNGGVAAAAAQQQERETAAGELRRGPWTVDEDLTLVNYIADHGEGRWNALARAAGLKRTGKSCRLRWLNYLRPDVKRGDFTADEQLLILELHSRWGNRWSKIAQQLPGRTDNEIKNYWRTRVQKHAKQLNCDVASQRFRDAMAYLWMPRLAEQASHQHSSAAGNDTPPCLISALTMAAPTCLAESYYDGRHSSPAGTTSSSVLTTSSASSSFTSESAHDDKSAHPHGGGGGDEWAMQEGADHEFWSTAPPALQQLDDDGQFQDMQELSGWVQGFSEGIVVSAADQSLWSLDDIWRMQ